MGELLQNYMLNTVINVLFKNSIALWRHLAKTQLLSFIHTVQIDLSITHHRYLSLSKFQCNFRMNVTMLNLSFKK